MADSTGTGAGGGKDDVLFSFGNDGAGPKPDASAASGNTGTVDPASVAAAAGGTGTGKRGRGRPAGSGNKPRASAGGAAQKAPLDLGFIEFALLGIHSMLASSLAIPELELTQDEGHKLAVAVQNVAAHYPLAIDPKAQAWMALFMVAGSLYGTRAYVYYARTTAAPEPQPQQSATFPNPAFPRAV